MSSNANQGVNIKVYVRARPLNKLEQARTNSLVKLHSQSNLIEIAPKQYQGNLSSKVYQFDRVFSPETTQKTFYEEAVSPLLDDFIQGYNATLMMYGPTGSGKSYSVFGENGCLDGVSSGGLDGEAIENSPSLGAIPRVVNELFKKLQAVQADFQLRVSNVEVYQEEIYDLLVENQSFRESLKIYEERQSSGGAGGPGNRNKVFIQNITEQLVKKTSEVIGILQRSNKNRKVAETKMNEHSSRSHSIFTLQLIQKQLEINQNTSQEIEFIKISKLHLVDLAGSESITKSGLDARSKAQAEAGNINKSLLTLGRVINALVDGTSFIPYRDSKLTRLLSDSLGGTTKTSIVATISLADLHADETGNTLDYMTRAKKIKNVPVIMQKVNSKTVLKEYSEEMQKLQLMLQQQRAQNGGIFISNEDYEAQRQREQEAKEQIEQLEAQMKELQKEMEKVTALLEQSHQRYNIVKGALSTSVDEYKDLQKRAVITDRKLRAEREAAAQNKAQLQVIVEQTVRNIQDGLSGSSAINLRHPFDEALRHLDGEIANLYKQQLTATSEAQKQLKTSLIKFYDKINAVCENDVPSNFGQLKVMNAAQQNIRETLEKQINKSNEQICDYVKSQLTGLTDICISDVETKVKLLSSRADGALKQRQKYAKEQGEHTTRHVTETYDQLQVMRTEWATELQDWIGKELISISSNAERVSLLQQGELLAMVQQKLEQQHNSLLGLVRGDLRELESNIQKRISEFTQTVSQMEQSNQRFRDAFNSRLERNASEAEEDFRELEQNGRNVSQAITFLTQKTIDLAKNQFPEQNFTLVTKPAQQITNQIKDQQKNLSDMLEKAENTIKNIIIKTTQEQTKEIEENQNNSVKQICILYNKQFNPVSIQGEEVRYQQLATLSAKVSELQRRTLEVAEKALEELKQFKLTEPREVGIEGSSGVEPTPMIPQSPNVRPVQWPDGLAQSRVIYGIQPQNQQTPSFYHQSGQNPYSTPSLSGRK